MASKARTEPGPRRVEAWIYGVINPLCEAVVYEQHLALVRKLTFRWRTGRLEAIRPFRLHLTQAGALILEDLEREHPEVGREELRHDEAVNSLEEQAQGLFGQLQRDPRFIALVTREFSAVSSEEHRVQDAAEDLINDRAETINAKRNTWASTWNKNLAALKKFQSSAAFDELFEELDSFEAMLSRTSKVLIGLRNRLVEQYDVPPAPIGL
jgi:hypothetical protein